MERRLHQQQKFAAARRQSSPISSWCSMLPPHSPLTARVQRDTRLRSRRCAKYGIWRPHSSRRLARRGGPLQGYPCRQADFCLLGIRCATSSENGGAFVFNFSPLSMKGATLRVWCFPAATLPTSSASRTAYPSEKLAAMGQMLARRRP